MPSTEFCFRDHCQSLTSQDGRIVCKMTKTEPEKKVCPLGKGVQ